MKMPLAVLSRCVFTYIVNKITLASRESEPIEVISLLSLRKEVKEITKTEMTEYLIK